LRILVNTGLFILFLLIVFAILSFWKGGEPFRWIGEATISIGEGIVNMGDGVDDFLDSNT